MQAIAVNPEMDYHVVAVKDGPEEGSAESLLIYAAERADALQEIQGLFPTPPVHIGELEGISLSACYSSVTSLKSYRVRPCCGELPSDLCTTA